jgi:methyl-accepting chemotaxis protein
VVDPAKAYYEKRRDVAGMVKWGAIDMVMNEAVIANVLNLKTAFHDYYANPNESTSRRFKAQFEATQKGLEEWKSTFNGEQLMVDAGNKTDLYYSKLSNLFVNLEKTTEQVAALKKGIDSKDKTLMAMLDSTMITVVDPAVKNAKNKAENNSKIASVVMGGVIVFAIVVLAIFVMGLVKELSGKIGLAAKYLEYVANGNLKSRTKVHSDLIEISALFKSLEKMRRGLRQRAEVLKAIASGDLTVQVVPLGQDDMLGNALHDMNSKLVSIVSQTIVSANQINTGTAQVADASSALSQGATEQASSIEEISSSMAELGSQTSQNAENATQANALSISTRDSAEKGAGQMNSMVEAMSKIGDSSKEIAKIIKVIDDIAFQTNLLALNAAVEAARAGKYGKGFAVVAEEVRTLAARSAKAAQETSELIEGSANAVEEGVAISQKTESALAEIVDSARKTADLVGEIAAASSEQAQGIAQINLGLDQIDKVTQQNTASAEETASAAEELSGQASELKNMMKWFKTGAAEGAGAVDSIVSEGNSDDLTNLDFAGSPDISSQSDQWGTSASNQLPQDVISLDDGDFGRY